MRSLSLVSKPCVTTCTDDGELQCDALGGGGVFAVSGILDATVYRGGKALRKKIDLGKQG